MTLITSFLRNHKCPKLSTLIQSLSTLQPSGSKFFLQISHSPGWQRRTLQCLSAGYVCTCSLVVLFTSSVALSSLSIHLLSPLVQLITTLFSLPGDHLLQITLSFILYDVIGHSETHQLLIVSYVYFFYFNCILLSFTKFLFIVCCYTYCFFTCYVNKLRKQLLDNLSNVNHISFS